METARVDICYRPLRIAWAIRSGDCEALREAVRLSHTMWGGRFNPIVMVDRAEQAKRLVELYRVDMIVPVGQLPTAKDIAELFPHLINPFFPNTLFLEGSQNTRARVLDIHNALAYWRDAPEWQAMHEKGVRRFLWDPDDPLADVFLLQYGAYPDATDIGIDYAQILSQATPAIDCHLPKSAPIAIEGLDHPSLGYLTRHGLKRHYTVRPGWDDAGFFVGDANNVDDLASFWNLRAADIQLQFFDPAHIDRFELIRPEYEKRTLAALAHRDKDRQNIAVWSREETINDAVKLFADRPLIACRVSDLGGGGSVCPPMMILGEASSLGIFGQQMGNPKVSFSLNAKPFCSDGWFYTQHLVASVAVYGDDEHYTFRPPYVPEWNEFFARRMHLHYNKLRVEPERIGIIIDAADHDSFVYGLPVPALVEKLFESLGLHAKLSGGGLITRQLISRLGGLAGARVFKIPGVRRLLRTYGPRDAFTKKAALQLIGGDDPGNPQASFADHKHLYIEPREHGTELTPQMVFAYLVEKGLFRIGVELTCPTCNLVSWIALDALKQENVCELCGTAFDATRQIVNGIFRYRRTGVLGLEKNTQGSIPVALVLQQLDTNCTGIGDNGWYAPSYDLVPNAGIDLPACEIDFLMLIPRTYPEKADLLIGECKDIGGAVDAKDVENLRRIADAVPANRFKTYIVFGKLAPFTPEEIALIKDLNEPFQQRVILLTARELEPYHIYDRTQKELGIESHGGSPRELAHVTSHIYFAQSPVSDRPARA
jgi:hypothetical protein